MKKLKELNGQFKNKKALILGNGMSVISFKKFDDTTVFGVNDINKFMDPDIHVIVDRISKFSEKRKQSILKTKASYVITQEDVGWVFPNNNQYTYKLGKYGKFDNFNNMDFVDYGLDSPYMSILIAHKLGFKTIGILGVDFTPGHFYAANDGIHQLEKFKRIKEVIKLYRILSRKLNETNSTIFNLSKTSRLTSIPFIEWEEFNKKIKKL